jgi:hypothetical protein
MPTIPDDHPQHHDTPQAPAEPVTLAGLRAQYPAWIILVRLDIGICTAEHRSADGRTIRYLVGMNLIELAARPATAECVKPTASALDSMTRPDGEQAAALAELRGLWQGEYWITYADGLWSASPFRDRRVVLTADSAPELRTKIQADYAVRRPMSSSGP